MIGDEKREKIIVKHKNVDLLGFLNHNKVLKYLKKTSIAIACSRWEEPFGRTSLEASANGCAVIITNKGGLPETVTNARILSNLSVKELYKEITHLIRKKNLRKKLQRLSIKNFYLTHAFVTNMIDNYRDEKLQLNKSFYVKKNEKIPSYTSHYKF